MAKEIRRLPIAPDSANPATFNARADAFVRAMQPFADDANALARELEEFSANVSQKNEDTNAKYNDLVAKYNDFFTKYGDFFAKYDIFVPAYLDIKSKHGEVETNKEHVDAVKKQIDEALQKAKDMINEGGIIDDTKTTLVSTYSSKKIQEQIDRIDADVAQKADENTAYKEWNYKEISDNFVAQNNDALFVNITKPITITLPSEGKVKIVDIAGNFFQQNAIVKTADSAQAFKLNRDYQRVEFVKFGGKWRISSGYLPQGTVFFRIKKEATTKVFGDGRANWCASHGEYIFYGNTALNIRTLTEKVIPLPVVVGNKSADGFFTRDNGVFYAVIANNTFSVFSLNLANHSWRQTISRNIANFQKSLEVPALGHFAFRADNKYYVCDGSELNGVGAKDPLYDTFISLKNCYVLFSHTSGGRVGVADKNGVVKKETINVNVSYSILNIPKTLKYMTTGIVKYYKINGNEDNFIEVSSQEFSAPAPSYAYEEEIMGQTLKIQTKERKATLGTPQGEQDVTQSVGYTERTRFVAISPQYLFLWGQAGYISAVEIEYINTKKEI